MCVHAAKLTHIFDSGKRSPVFFASAPAKRIFSRAEGATFGIALSFRYI